MPADLRLLDDEQRALIQMVREFADEVLSPAAPGYEERSEDPAPLYAQLADLGLTGIPYAEEYGGGGQPYVTYLLIAINVLVFVFLQGLGSNERFTYAFSTVPQEIRTGEDVARPVIHFQRAGTCWHPQVKGVVLQVSESEVIVARWNAASTTSWITRAVTRDRRCRSLSSRKATSDSSTFLSPAEWAAAISGVCLLMWMSTASAWTPTRRPASRRTSPSTRWSSGSAAVLAPWLYAPAEPRRRLLWFAGATLLAGALAEEVREPLLRSSKALHWQDGESPHAPPSHTSRSSGA